MTENRCVPYPKIDSITHLLQKLAMGVNEHPPPHTRAVLAPALCPARHGHLPVVVPSVLTSLWSTTLQGEFDFSFCHWSASLWRIAFLWSIRLDRPQEGSEQHPLPAPSPCCRSPRLLRQDLINLQHTPLESTHAFPQAFLLPLLLPRGQGGQAVKA